MCLTTEIPLNYFPSHHFFYRSHNDSLFEPSCIPFDRNKARNYALKENFFEWVLVARRWERKEIKANYRRRCLLLAASLQLILFDTSMTPRLILHADFRRWQSLSLLESLTFDDGGVIRLITRMAMKIVQTYTLS